MRSKVKGRGDRSNSWLTHMHGSVVHKKLRFGPFELSIGERVLRRDGQSLPLGGRALEIWSILPIARVSHREAGTDGSRLVGRNR